MHVGIQAPFLLPYVTPAFIADAARAAEDAGFQTIWAPEHVVLFDDYDSTYPYTPNGKLRGPGNSPILEPFDYLTFLAAATKRIRIGTAICLLAQRNPVYTAKQAATIDYLSGGRFDLGVGIGWLAEEFAAVQVPFETRAQRTRSYVAVMRSLWCDEVSAHNDEYYTLPPCRQYPKPIQTPHPPIHFGGESDAALRRAADMGQGWFGFGLTPERAAERITRLRSLLAERGRDASEVQITVSPGPGPVDFETARQFAEAGADQLVVSCVTATADAYFDSIRALSTDLVAPCADL